MDYYYNIDTLADDPSEPDAEWFARFVDANWKDRCRRHTPVHFPIDVMIKREGAPTTINFVQRTSVSYARTEFLDVVGLQSVELDLGRVIDASGRCLDSLRTFGSNQPIRLRGGPKSQWGICPDCEQLYYTPDFYDRRYILESDLTGQSLYYSDGAIVVSHELATRIRVHRWEKLSIERVKVVSQPCDGLPADLFQLKASELPSVVDAVRLVGWNGSSVGDVRSGIDELVQRYGETIIDRTTDLLYQVDGDSHAGIVQLNELGRSLAVQILSSGQ